MNRRRWLAAATLVPAAPWLQACSRAAPVARPLASAANTDTCAALPVAGSTRVPPALPPDAVDVRQHGVRGDGHTPDGAALQRVFDSAQPGQTLWFPPGAYVYERALTLRQQRVTLHGYGATLHATDPASQALIVQGAGCRVLGFTLTAVTDVRRAAPWESRIAVWRDGGTAPIDGVQILDNRIVAAGPAGTPLANSSSSAAIYLERASRFVVAGNVVERSLSDSIHITGGSSAGLVAGNRVRDSGDDMIAVVSYLDADAANPLPPVAELLAQWPARRQQHLVHDVLITGNDLSGAYWGRGISVVGGEDVSIVDNNIDRCSHAAAIYVAREPGWRTFGVRNVRVTGNRISRVQQLPPAYSVLAEPDRSARTGHAGIEIVAHLDDVERALSDRLGIECVLVEHNRVGDCMAAGIRVGDGWGARTQAQADAGQPGAAIARWTGAPVRGVTLRHNEVMATPDGIVVANAGDTQAALQHAGNRVDGRPWAPPSGVAAQAGSAVPTGSTVRCSGI